VLPFQVFDFIFEVFEILRCGHDIILPSLLKAFGDQAYFALSAEKKGSSGGADSDRRVVSGRKSILEMILGSIKIG